jgi:hypothetical protein
LWDEHAERELKLMDIVILKSVFGVAEDERRILLSSAPSSTVQVS